MDTVSNQEANIGVIQEVIGHLSTRIGETIYGHEETARLLTGAFLIGGHVLLEGPPGIAKTLMARTFAQSLGLRFNRVQFTPDLMPSDVTGVYIFDQKSAEFRFAPGAIFADVILADEINRTPPKTQSALLEAMEERFVTIDGTRHPLDPLFFVVATQNPIEHEGTFPLPEAQLDRFLFKIVMTYPEVDFEVSMIQEFSATVPEYSTRNLTEQQPTEQAVLTRDTLEDARRQLRAVTLDRSVADYIRRIADATRSHPDLMLGASPRAALNLALAAKFQAARDGRNYTIPDDVKAMVPYVLPHRLILQPEIFDTERSIKTLMDEILDSVSVPDRAVA